MTDRAHRRMANTTMNKDGGVERLLRSIGMFDCGANKSILDARSMELFARRELEFDWTHMGNSEIRVGQVIDALHETPHMLPPRTGHIGNWTNIVNGRAGPRDYNHMICGSDRLGYPLLFDFNQTEADVARSGDWSYIPGSVVHRTERKALELFTWDGASFCRRDRRESFFTPFTLTPVEGQLVPLAKLHRDIFKKIGKFQFRLQSDLLARRETLVRDILYVSLEDARSQERPDQILRRILDRSVTADGRVTRTTLELSGQGFRMGGARYANTREIVDHVMLPILLAARPESIADGIKELPWQMPVISASLFVLILAVLNTHYPDVDKPTPELTRPCNPHLHWGGIPMAGYPPQDRGYFAENTRHLRKLFRPVIRELSKIDPVFYVLLPAGVFNLCPHDSFPDDIGYLATLMSRVRADTDHLAGKPTEIKRRIEQIADDWLPTAEPALSGYFISRFTAAPGTVISLPAPVEGKLIMPPGFTALTLQQASMIMGVLSQVRWTRQQHLQTGAA